MEKSPDTRVRIDKWLWAARFYKTRSIAKTAIEGGKVYYNGNRTKVSKEIQVGDTIRVRQGYDEKTVTVAAISDRRGNATLAATLYLETQESVDAREAARQARKAAGLGAQIHSERPNKQQRRKLQQFKRDSNATS